MRLCAAEPHLALLGRELARDDAEERGLAGAVAADEPDPGAGRQRDRGVFEQPAAADTIGDVVDGEHASMANSE